MDRKMKTRTSAAAFCIALLGFPALSQPRGGPPPGAAPGEAPGGDRGQLTQLFVSPSGAPFRAGPTAPYPVAAWFSKADANHDGLLDRDEFRADADAFFKTLDVNDDGVLSGYEVSRYEHVVLPEILRGRDVGWLQGRARIFLAQVGGMDDMGGGMDHRDPGGHGPAGGDDGPPSGGRGERAAPSTEGAAPFNLLGEPEPVASSDLDFDSRITRAEFQSKADRSFRRLDTQGAGKLTLASLPMTMQQKMLAGRRRGPPRAS
jgi:hypothetical protein